MRDRICNQQTSPTHSVSLFRIEMNHPSQDAIFFALLQFGASCADVQRSLMADYRRVCVERGGGPNVWEPNVEIIEAVRGEAFHFADHASGVALELAEDVVAATDALLEQQRALIDGSGFSSDAAGALRSSCEHQRHEDDMGEQERGDETEQDGIEPGEQARGPSKASSQALVTKRSGGTIHACLSPEGC
jgi:hypothetical protein